MLSTMDVPDSIFRAYDIRGEYGSQLTEGSCYQIGQTIATLLGTSIDSSESPTIILGRDGRLSSPVLAAALCKGLQRSGCDVLDLGIVPTPAVYFAIEYFDIGNAVMVTGSHNPAQHNGIKIVADYECVYGDQIQQIKHMAVQQVWQVIPVEQQGQHRHQSILSDYVASLCKGIQLKRPLKIAVDCGNGAASLVAKALFDRLGCQTDWLYNELDGHFPNHSPDPTQPENLEALQALVLSKQLDIGLAFDGDADRMIAVYQYDGEAHILWADRVMMLLAFDLLQQHPDCLFLYDVKCSHLLPRWIALHGGRSQMIASGHSYLKAAMKDQQAIMGGEFSGHIVLADRAQRFYADDGLYLAVRLLEVLARRADLLAILHEYCRHQQTTPEIAQAFESPKQAAGVMQRYIEVLLNHADLKKGNISLIDGFRVDFDDAWGVARASNTSSCITWRFEADTPERLRWIKQQFKMALVDLDELPLAYTNKSD